MNPLQSLSRFAGVAPLVLRLVLGVVMFAHGLQKLTGPGPVGFGQGALAPMGVPFPVFFGYLVTYGELIGGVALIVGLLTRLVALALTANLIGAILLVKVDVGLIGQGGAGAELDLTLIAGLVSLALLGPGGASLDRALGLERLALAISATV